MRSLGKQGLRRARIRFGLCGLVQIHHVIPLEHAMHPVVQHLGFDIDSAQNLILMPTREGAETLRLRPGRLIHDGGHMHYNTWVETLLSENVSNHHEFHEVLSYLHSELRRSDARIPWR